MNHRLLWLLTLLRFFALCSFASLVQAQSVDVSILLDRGGSAGCTVTGSPSVEGVDARVTARVDGPGGQVDALTLETCADGSFGSPQNLDGGYPVGLNNGVSGSDVVELSVPVAAVSPGVSESFGLTAMTGDGVNADQGAGGVLGVIVPVPISFWAAAVLALLLVVLAFWVIRRRQRAAVLLLGLAAFSVWAAHFMLDGQIDDWSGISPVGDASGDAGSDRADILAVFAAEEDGRFWFRVDLADVENAAPEGNPDVGTTNEDTVLNIAAPGVLANDSDPDGDALSVSAADTVSDEGASVSVNADGSYSYDPTSAAALQALDDGEQRIDRFGYTVSDGSLQDGATVEITMAGANDAPVAQPDAFVTDEDTAINGDLFADNGSGPDSDIDGEGFIMAFVNGVFHNIPPVTLPSGAVLQIDQDGTLSYDPDGAFEDLAAGEQAVDSFTYRVGDDVDLSNTVTVTITITGVNDAPAVSLPTAGVNYQSFVGPVAIDPAAIVTDIDSTDFDTGDLAVSVALAASPADCDPLDLLTIENQGNGAGQIGFDGSNVSYEGTVIGTLLSTFACADLGGGSFDVTPLVVTFNAASTPAAAQALVRAVQFDTASANDADRTATVLVSDGDGATSVPVSQTLTLTFNTAPTADPQGVVTDEETPVAIVLTGSDPESDPLTFTIVSGPAHGTLSGAPPNITYTPDADYEGPDSFEFQVEDPSAASDTAIVSITVNGVNDAPVVDPAAFSVAEDEAVGTTVGPVTFTDPDAGQSHTFAITAGNTGGAFAIDASTGEITVAAALDFETLAAYSLTVEVTDDGAPVLSGAATIDITVTDADDPPVAVADAATVTEDDPATTIDVLANDTDVDGGPISIQSVTQPANGTVIITGGGADLTYQPDPNVCNDGTPTDDFSYTLNGGSTGTVSITVTCVDDDPVAVADAATVTEDDPAAAIDVLANDTDVDAGPISVDSVTQAGNGTVVITGGGTGLTYQPNADYCNTPPGAPLDTFTYTLTPGASTATVTVTVTCEDDAPIAVADAATVGEDSGANAIDVLANDADVDGGPRSVQSVTQPADGLVAITGGGTGVSYTPNANYCNDGTPTDDFTYTLNGGSSTTVAVTVTCADDPPLAVDDTATVGEDSGANPVDVLLNDTDIDGGAMMVTLVQSPSADGGTVTITGGGSGVAYAPAANYCNSPPGTTPDTFNYTINGGSTATVSVTVTCVDDAPVLDLDADDDKGTGGADFAVAYTEGDGTELLQDPDDPTGATITDIDSTTLVSLTVTLTNLLDAGEELLDADVSAFAPDITKDYDTTTPGVGVLTISSVTSQPIADYVAVLRTVTYAHAGNDPDETARGVQFVANDGSSDSNTAVSTVTITAVDDPPVAVADAATVNEDSGANAIDALANDTDTDGGPIEIQSVTQPANGTVAITGGGTGLAYTPNPDYCNDGTPTDDFTYTLNGGASTTVVVSVTCVDDDPVAVADAATVVEDSGANAIDVLANDTDVDGGPITLQSVTQPANGSVSITGGGTGLTYQPNADFCNDGTPTDTFTYTLNGGSSTTVSVTVTCVDDDPTAVADAATVVEDSGVNAIDVLANDTDVDGGAITIGSVTQPANGTVIITGGGTGVAYTSSPNYCNSPPGTMPDTFTYTLTPGGSSTTVSMTVTCVDDPPVAVADAATVNEDSGANAIDVLANDTDVDGGPISVTSVTQPSGGTVAITGGGTGVSYTPNLNYCNDGSPLDTFTYTLTPGGSATTVSMTVVCINDPPVAGNDAFDFIGNTELRVDHGAAATPHALETTTGGTGVLENDSDPVEGDPISIVGVTVGACVDNSAPFDCSDPNVGRVQMDADGSFSFLPARGDAGASESFQYTLSDGTDTTIGTVTLTRFERVWYIDNSVSPGGDGTSAQPFNAITAANLNDNDSDGDLADDLDAADDYIFVHFGNGTDGNLSGGLFLEGGQHLIGEHAGLSLPVNINGNGSPTVLVAAAPGSRPLLDDNVADGFDGVVARNVIPAEIVGMNLAGDVNAIDWTTTAAFGGAGAFSIRDNVVRSAGAEGIDINLAGTGGVELALHDNNLTATGTALDLQETGTGLVTVTRFDDNVVNGNTGGSGIVINSAVFDAIPGGALNTVDGGNTAVGASGNGVGGSGLLLTSVQGDLHFTGNLSVFADAGTGLQVSGTGAGMQLRVNSGGGATGTVQATGGPAVNASAADLDLRLTSLQSTNSSSTGVSLTNVTGTFSAEAGSAITNASGTDFAISGGTAGVTYRGTITDDVGQLVSVSGSTAGTKAFEGAITDGDDGDGSGILLSSNSGATIRFSGGLVLSTGGNPAFAATGGGSVVVCDENPCNGGATGGLINRITTTTGTALNVANTGIGAQNVEFRSISAGTGASGPTNGIVVNNTGSAGGLKVKGTGSAGSGGTIQQTTGDGISLTSTQHVELSHIVVTNGDEDGIDGTSVTNFALTNSSVTSNGNAANEEGISFSNLSGAVTLNNVVATGNAYNNLRIDNTSGTISALMITGGSYSNNLAGIGNHGILIEPRGSSQITSATVMNATISGNEVMGMQVATADTANVADFLVEGNTIQNNELGVDFSRAQTSNLTFAVQNNLGITGQNSHGMNYFAAVGAGTTGLFRGRLAGNTIGNAAVDGSGSAIGNCMRININGDADADFLVSGTTARECPNGRGVEAISRNGTGGLDLTVANNDIDHTNLTFMPGSSDFPLSAIVVQSNCATVCNSLRADVTGNTVPAGMSFDFTSGFISLIETSTSVLQLVDTAPASADCAGQLSSTNTGSVGVLGGCALIAGPINTPP